MRCSLVLAFAPGAASFISHILTAAAADPKSAESKSVAELSTADLFVESAAAVANWATQTIAKLIGQLVPVRDAERVVSDTTAAVLTVYCLLLISVVLLTPLLLTVFLFRKRLISLMLSAVDVDSLAGSILRGPKTKTAIVDLVGGVLEEERMQSAIAHVVSGALKNQRTQRRIANVVSSVLSEEDVREKISSTVALALTDAEIEAKISSTVGNCLSNETVAAGIVDAIKGSTRNVLSEVSAPPVPTAGFACASRLCPACNRQCLPFGFSRANSPPCALSGERPRAAEDR